MPIFETLLPPGPFWWGIAGGLSIELLKIYNLRHLSSAQRPDWLTSVFYWGPTIVMVGAGGGLVLLYLASKMEVSPIIAFNIGASAPLVLKEGFAALEKPSTSDKDPSSKLPPTPSPSAAPDQPTPPPL